MGSQRGGLVGIARRWWPAVAFVAVALVAQQVLLTNRYDVDGHAAGHLGNAGAPFFATAMLLTMLWATPPARRQLDVLVAAAAWLGAAVVILAGNLRVVDELIDAGLGRAPEEGLVDVADHSLAERGMWLAVLASLLLVAVMWRRAHVSPRVAGGAAVLSVLFPPWIIPGAGVIVLVIARCIAHARAQAAVSVGGGRS